MLYSNCTFLVNCKSIDSNKGQTLFEVYKFTFGYVNSVKVYRFVSFLFTRTLCVPNVSA